MKTALLIDGGYLRAAAQRTSRPYDVAFIKGFADGCLSPDEYLLRVLYYDAPQFVGKAKLPVSGQWKKFVSTDRLLDDLAKLERFACRRGSLGFRGWKPKNLPIDGGRALVDTDFVPIFEQKGVDMRVGLDIANFAQQRSVDRILLVSGDTDMIPAMKHARKAGLEVMLVQLPPPAYNLHDNLLQHADAVRPVIFPQQLTTAPTSPAPSPPSPDAAISGRFP